MIKNFKFQISNSRGITLIEIVVVIVIIALFSSILISDFPKIQRQFALSRATYKLAQNLRKTEDLGLSGLQEKDGSGQLITTIKGYGIYVDLSQPANTTKYLIYADVDSAGLGNRKYDGNFSSSLCSISTPPVSSDCVIDLIDISKEDAGVNIKEIDSVDANGNITLNAASSVSINFTPPNPDVTITTDPVISDQKAVNIVLSLDVDDSITRTVSINMSGLIEIK